MVTVYTASAASLVAVGVGSGGIGATSRRLSREERVQKRLKNAARDLSFSPRASFFPRGSPRARIVALSLSSRRRESALRIHKKQR